MNTVKQAHESNSNFNTSTFEIALDNFVQGCQQLINQNYTDSPLDVPILEFSMGKRYVKVIRNDGVQRSVYCFVDITNGNVLKAAGWSAPAKGARGNIFDEHNGLRRMSAYGAGYNR